MKHEWDFITDCCKKCGQTHVFVFETGRPCNDCDNLIAITHLIYRKRFAELIASKI